MKKLHCFVIIITWVTYKSTHWTVAAKFLFIQTWRSEKGWWPVSINLGFIQALLFTLQSSKKNFQTNILWLWLSETTCDSLSTISSCRILCICIGYTKQLNSISIYTSCLVIIYLLIFLFIKQFRFFFERSCNVG